MGPLAAAAAAVVAWDGGSWAPRACEGKSPAFWVKFRRFGDFRTCRFGTDLEGGGLRTRLLLFFVERREKEKKLVIYWWGRMIDRRHN